jgi:hypothetical protein
VPPPVLDRVDTTVHVEPVPPPGEKQLTGASRQGTGGVERAESPETSLPFPGDAVRGRAFCSGVLVEAGEIGFYEHLDSMKLPSGAAERERVRGPSGARRHGQGMACGSQPRACERAEGVRGPFALLQPPPVHVRGANLASSQRKAPEWCLSFLQNPAALSVGWLRRCSQRPADPLLPNA